MANKLKEELDRVFSIFIRLRDSNSDGTGRCISCPTSVNWKEADNGHYIDRAHMGTRFNPTNCNLQCRGCNRQNDGNLEGYKKGLIEKYGETVIDELTIEKHRVTKYTPADYRELIGYYRAEIKKLQKEKTLVTI